MKRKIYKLLSGAKQGLFTLALIVSGTAHAQQTYSFTYTGAMQTLNLPSGVWGIECWGADGGDVTAGPGGGGKGGYSKGTLNMMAAGTINIFVGGKGFPATGSSASAGAGGWNGGGGGAAVGRSGGGGGGATDVRVGGTGAANRVIVAGGGGGAAYYSVSPFLAPGGNGGGPTGLNGDIITSAGVLTPGGGAPGANGASPGMTAVLTANGDANGGGGGGISANASIGQPGIGGGAGGAAGASAGGSTGSAGGGGGGFAGGAGGVQTTNAGVAGGGGSGYIGGVTSGTNTSFGQPGFVTNPDALGNGYIIIKELCNIGLNASKNPICLGESITLSTNALGGIVWSHNGSSNSSVNVSPTSNTTYTVTGQGVNSCTTSIALTVIVNPLPVLSAIVVPSVVCVGKSATINASGAVTYTWASTGATGATTTVSPTSSASYNYSGSNQFGCTTSTMVNVGVDDNTLGITSNTSVCLGNSVQLQLSNAVTYTWSTGNNFATTFVTPVTNTTYIGSGTDIHNCVLTNMVAVTVNQKPNVIANANKGNVCKGESVTLTAGGATTYSWSNGLGTAPSVNVTLPVETVYSYAVTGADANGCINTANVQATASRCTGINEAGKEASYLNVYPNPAMDKITVETSNGLIQDIVVTDLTGRIVKSFASENNSAVNVNISDLSSGVYYFNVKSTERSEIIKVVKN